MYLDACVGVWLSAEVLVMSQMIRELSFLDLSRPSASWKYPMDKR